MKAAKILRSVRRAAAFGAVYCCDVHALRAAPIRPVAGLIERPIYIATEGGPRAPDMSNPADRAAVREYLAHEGRRAA